MEINNNIYRKLAGVVGFYDSPTYFESDSKPWYYDYYTWGLPSKASRDGFVWRTMYYGFLKEEIFKTDDSKIYYLKGMLEDCTNNTIFLANSQKTLERCVLFCRDINYKFVKIKDYYGTDIISVHTQYRIPICHTIELNKELVDFIKNY